MEALPGALYYAPHDWMGHVIADTGPGRRIGPFYHCTDGAPASVWAQARLAPLWKIQFGSISEAATQLKALGPSWYTLLWTLHRRGELIADKARALKPREREWPFRIPMRSVGAFTLMDEHTILACPAVDNPFVGAHPHFLENKVDPPSSAYLKLQEALVRLDFVPGPEDRCMDAGACPGGWTWVLSRGGAQVDAIDRSPLDERLMKNPRISFSTGNAFSRVPAADEGYDIICSDVICYPQAIWEWYCKLAEAGSAKRYALTIKMQGEPDREVIELFRSVEGGLVYHSAYNKHELTFIWPAPAMAAPPPTRQTAR